MSTYLFIDLRNFTAGYDEVMSKIFGDTYAPNLDLVRQYFRADRVYVYDALPSEARTNETDLQFKERRAESEERLSRIARMDDFFVRAGTQSRSSKREKQLEQKEVDVLLAVELVTNAFRGTVTHAVLLAGDLDYRPAVHAAVEAGTRVTVGCFPHKVSRAGGLIEAADRWVPLRVPWCVSVCDPANVPPSFGFSYIANPSDEATIPFGPYASIELIRNDQGEIRVNDDERTRPWRAPRDIVEAVFAFEYGDEVKLPPGW